MGQTVRQQLRKHFWADIVFGFQQIDLALEKARRNGINFEFQVQPGAPPNYLTIKSGCTHLVILPTTADKPGGNHGS